MDNRNRFDRLVIVAYRLPLRYIRTREGYRSVQNSGGLVSAILALSESLRKEATMLQHKKVLWAGAGEVPPLAAGGAGNDVFDLLPVKIPSDLNDQFYGGFCNDLIWPLFHYFPSYAVFNSRYFRAYHEANRIFCERIVPELKPGDFVWIHDYQLFLLPEMIREKVPDVTIGFFLHIPFPSSEIFRMLPHPWREDLIRGILGSDLVGFHTHDYSQHFLRSVKRTTGYECRQNIIYTPHKIVKVDAFPISIDYKKFSEASMEKAVLKEKKKIWQGLGVQKLIFSIDRLDYTKGLLSRLQGFEVFLETYPEWRSKVVFNMVVIPSRDNIQKYLEMKKEIESTVGRINGKFSNLAWRPVVYQYKSLSFNELVALYDMSDVGLITPLRDGMNLVAKEYVACQNENKGVLILSEMAGAAAELNEALIIHPADAHELAEAIYKALEMGTDEKEARLRRMQDRIRSYNVFTWAHDFLNQAGDVKNRQKGMQVKYIGEGTARKIRADYHTSCKRILFLDYDGTLVNFSRYPELAVIESEPFEIVRSLSLDPLNTVVIISGRGREFLEKQFAGLAVVLVAEHGFFVKVPGEEWTNSVDVDLHWKESVMPILQEYVDRCNGTFIEEKTGSIAWHYRNADRDFAELRLNELRDDLSEIIRYKTDFEILEGNNVLEVKSGKYDKGLTAAAMISGSEYDFILAAGDDKTDELLFRALPETAVTIRVGLNLSFARYNVSEIRELLNLLQSLTVYRQR
jgi:trehalose 6-phosphate synthase/phosphatase